MNWAGGMHWSQSRTAWLGFFANLTDGRILVRHELTFTETAPEDAALEIHRACKQWAIPVPAFWAQPGLFPAEKKSRGETISETFQKAGISMRQGDDDRVNGWSRMRSWLQLREWDDADGKPFISPGLLIHSDCVVLASVLPTLLQDEEHPDDVMETFEEYPANGVRFYLMSRPSPTVKPERVIPPDSVWWDLEEIREANRRLLRVE